MFAKTLCSTKIVSFRSPSLYLSPTFLSLSTKKNGELTRRKSSRWRVHQNRWHRRAWPPSTISYLRTCRRPTWIHPGCRSGSIRRRSPCRCGDPRSTRSLACRHVSSGRNRLRWNPCSRRPLAPPWIWYPVGYAERDDATVSHGFRVVRSGKESRDEILPRPLFLLVRSSFVLLDKDKRIKKRQKQIIFLEFRRAFESARGWTSARDARENATRCNSRETNVFERIETSRSGRRTRKKTPLLLRSFFCYQFICSKTSGARSML